MLRIQELREEKKLFQKDLAKKLNKTSACISSWETSKTEPDLDSLIKIADILEVSIDYLVGRSDDTGVIEINAELTDKHKELLSLFSKMSEQEQNQLLGFAKALVR